MASWADLKELRLRISDPEGFIDLETVETEDDLPDEPVAQTAYRVEDVAEYREYNTEMSAWDRLDLLVSDSRLSSLIDASGSPLKAAPGAIRLIIGGIGQRLGAVKKHDAGGESTEFVTLRESYDFYKLLLEQFQVEDAKASGTSSGMYVRTRRPDVGGGMMG